MSPKMEAAEAARVAARMAALPEPDLTDPENPEWTEADFARARPPEEVLPPEVLAQFPNTKVGGRPRSAAPKKQITLRLAPDIIEHYRQTGPGWQTRIEAALRARMGKAKPTDKRAN